MDEKQKQELKKKIKKLKEMKGEGTELISLYIPPDYNVSQEVRRLKTEYSEAANIKSKSTRKNVQSAVKSLLQTLKGVNKPPENGVALFCGYIDGKVEQYKIVPPEPIQSNLYRCSNEFYLEPLEKLVESREKYGLVAIDGKTATIGKLRGKNVEIIQQFSSKVPSKHTKGGWSQKRFERLINEAKHEYFKKVASVVNQEFQDDEIKGVILGGPGQSKDKLHNEEYLNKKVMDKVMGKVSTSYADESGINELLDKSEDMIRDLEVQRERQSINDFIQKISTNELATYGLKEVTQALKKGKVKKLLISNEVDWEKVKVKCPNCGEEKKLVKDWEEFQEQGRKCPECGEERNIEDKKKITDKLEELAEQTGAEVEYISTDTDKGQQFHEAFGGIGAILRY